MNEPVIFLDTNVLLRHIMQDHHDRSYRATALMVAIEEKQRSVQCADTVIFEAAFTLEKTYHLPRETIREALQSFIELPAVVLPGKSIFAGVFALYVANSGLSIADCYHIELAKHLTRGSILSFDRRLGTINGISREEP